MNTAILEYPLSSPVLTPREEGESVIYKMGTRTFRLNKVKARERLAGKRVINGHRSAELNVLPLKYHEAYRIYKQIGSLNIDLDEVTAKFSDIQSVQRKNAFITRQMPELKMGINLTQTSNKQKFAKAIFGITQVMEGTQFYALFAMILSLHRQNKMTGIGQMFQYTLRDESNHIALGRYILTQLIAENPDVWTPEFRAELIEFMREGLKLEKEFVRDCLPEDGIGMTQSDFLDYVDFNADRRLTGLGLPGLSEVRTNPFPWLDEVIFLRKEKNFFETRVTEYQTSGSLKNTAEDDLI